MWLISLVGQVYHLGLLNTPEEAVHEMTVAARVYQRSLLCVLLTEEEPPQPQMSVPATRRTVR